MNQQLAYLIKQTPLNELRVALKVMINYNDVSYQPPDLDAVFMNELLNEYEKQSDPNFQAFAKAERFLLQTMEMDSEHFFERQYLMLQKELEQELYLALYEQLFKFRVRMNGQFTKIFRLKQFETFEQLLKKQLQHLSPRHTISQKRVEQRKTLFQRPSTLGKMLLRAFTKSTAETEQLLQEEPLYSTKEINGLLCYQLPELEQFTKQEQKIILNVSVDQKKLCDSDSDQEDEIPLFQLNQPNVQNTQNHKVIERQNYLEYIYGIYFIQQGNTKKLESVIMSSLPFNTKQQIEDENMISTTALLRPLLNQQSAESVLIYGNKLPNKNFIRKEKDLWKIAKQKLSQQYRLFSNDHQKYIKTNLRVYQGRIREKQMISMVNTGLC